MSKLKKFRKNNWWDDESDAVMERKNPKQKKFDQALRTRDIDYFNSEDDDY